MVPGTTWRGFDRRAAWRACPFLAAALFFWLVHSLAATGGQVENIYTTPGAYALNVFRNIALGAWHSLVPGGFDYLVTATREEAAVHFQLPGGMHLALMVIFMAGLIAATVFSFLKKKRMVALGTVSGLLALAPVCGLVPIGAVFALRFLLIPSFFFLLAAGAALQGAAEKRMSIAGFRPSLSVLVLVTVLLVYAGFSVFRVPEWKNDVILMRSTLEHEPRVALAHFLLGNGLAGQGLADEAITHYRKALELRSPYPAAEHNLRAMLERGGRTEEAE